MKLLITTFISLLLFTSNVQSQKIDNRSPLTVATSIGNKLVRETPFKYRVIIPQITTVFNDVQVVDFSKNFDVNTPSVAYAFTTLTSNIDIAFPIQLEHNDGCKIWINNKLVYDKSATKTINIKFEERSILMHDSCILPLKKGVNKVLIKSETSGKGKWQFFMQPPSNKGAIVTTVNASPTIGLRSESLIDSSVSKITNWILIGPFDNKLDGKKRTGLNTTYMPEKEIEFGKMYKGKFKNITWVLPNISLVGDVINPKFWGTSYNWNYHNGGVAWAMEQLSEITKDPKYMKYADDFCNFHLNSKPFIEYQVNELHQFNAANSNFINTPLLDFTLAPSLPLIYKIRTDHANFENKLKYTLFVDSMMRYALYHQLRLPSSNIFTRSTPVKYTTWVDDMFMGIPFLVQASLYTKDKPLSNKLLDDAANQIIGFNHEVFDESIGLYSHAHTVGSKVKLPHWSRANGWGIWATTEVLMNLPRTHENYNTILNDYKKHVASLSKLQDSTGLWHNVLDEKNSTLEVSGSAIFALTIARGIRLGWLNKEDYLPIVNKAWEGIKSCIESDGTVHNICMGTMSSEDVHYYMNRPYFDNDTHGLFAVLFACMEIEKLNNKN